MSDRVVPHDLAAEASLIGAAIIDSDAVLPGAEGWIEADDFFRPAHGILWNALRAMSRKGVPPDLVTLISHLETTGEMDAVGGREYLMHMAAETPLVSSWKHYGEIVKDRSVRRKLIQQSYRMAEDAHRLDAEADEIVAEHTEQLAHLVDSAPDRHVSLHEASQQAMQTLKNRMEQDIEANLRVGIPALDRATGGFGPGDMAVIAGRPGVGKTGLVMQWAWQLASRGKKGLVIEAEMTAEELAGRIQQGIANVHGLRIRNGSLSLQELHRLDDAARQMEHWPLEIVDRPCRPSEIRMRIRSAANRMGRLDFVVVDYLQRLPADGNCKHGYETVTAVSSALKSIALEERVVLFCVSSLNLRDSTEKPTMGNLRLSGDIEYDANQVILLHSPSGEKLVAHPSDPGNAAAFPVWGRVAKCRSGSETPWPDEVGGVEFGIRLRFYKAFTSFGVE